MLQALSERKSKVGNGNDAQKTASREAAFGLGDTNGNIFWNALIRSCPGMRYYRSTSIPAAWNGTGSMNSWIAASRK